MQEATLAPAKGPKDALEVSEIYVSLQGESSLAGLPTIFVRLFRCNLRCSWCDSFYAVEGGDFTRSGVEEMVARVDDLMARCEKGTPRRGISHVCWTGGEPLLQWRLMVEVMKRLPDTLVHTIETDGEVPIAPVNAALGANGLRQRVHYIMDIKCPGSGMKARLAFENLTHLDHQDEVKFVLLDRWDYEFARDVVTRCDIPCETILFSPVVPAHHVQVGLSPTTLAGWILEDGLDVRLQVQLHKILWPGKERGI